MGKVTNRKVAPMPKLHFGTKNSILAKTTEVPFIGFTALFDIEINVGISTNFRHCLSTDILSNKIHHFPSALAFGGQGWNRVR